MGSLYFQCLKGRWAPSTETQIHLISTTTQLRPPLTLGLEDWRFYGSIPLSHSASWTAAMNSKFSWDVKPTYVLSSMIFCTSIQSLILWNGSSVLNKATSSIPTAPYCPLLPPEDPRFCEAWLSKLKWQQIDVCDYKGGESMETITHNSQQSSRRSVEAASHQAQVNRLLFFINLTF